MDYQKIFRIDCYQHAISLGSFCSPAMELERFGFRDASYPFDWLLTHTFSNVLDLIDNHFERFLNTDDLYQRDNERSSYENPYIDCVFVHDFSKWKRFSEQTSDFVEKYKRRIDKFYQAISTPTLFLRYIENANERDFILSKYEEIRNRLKRFNEDNEIVYFSNADLLDEIDGGVLQDKNIIKVISDSGDTVARKFFDQVPEFLNALTRHYPEEIRRQNLIKFRKKDEKKKREKYLKKANTFLHKTFDKEYKHEKVISEWMAQNASR